MTATVAIISDPRSRGSLVTWSPRRHTLQSFVLFHWLGSHLGSSSGGKDATRPRAVKCTAELSSRRGQFTNFLQPASQVMMGRTRIRPWGQNGKLPEPQKGSVEELGGCRWQTGIPDWTYKAEPGERWMAAPRHVGCASSSRELRSKPRGRRQ